MSSSSAAAVPDGAEALPRKRGMFDLSRSPVARFLGNLGWPILQKEIRADFRKNRFFITHLVCLAVLGAGILFKVVSGADEHDAQPAVIGRDLFNTFLVIQYLVVVVVFPAFSANALSEERSA